MSLPSLRPLVQYRYANWAEEYLRGLPPEHFMEATAQATQRKITVECFDLVHDCPDFTSPKAFLLDLQPMRLLNTREGLALRNFAEVFHRVPEVDQLLNLLQIPPQPFLVTDRQCPHDPV